MRSSGGRNPVYSSRDCFFFLSYTISVWISIQIPKGMDGPMKHETSARCRASRSVKQSSIFVVKYMWNFTCISKAVTVQNLKTMGNFLHFLCPIGPRKYDYQAHWNHDVVMGAMGTIFPIWVRCQGCLGLLWQHYGMIVWLWHCELKLGWHRTKI